ncbi:Ig-like domain-containing protein [Pseudescherichia vulneris]
MPFSVADHPPSLQQKLVAWVCVALQLLPPLSGIILAAPAIASEQHMLPTASHDSAPKNPFEQQIASGAMALGTTLSDEDRTSSEALSDYARAQAGSAVNSTVEGWLSQFGTVRSQISLDNNFSLDDSSLDMLLPLYDSPGNMLFSQMGARRKDDRTTVNLGLGMRFFPSEAWMLGANAFYDNDLTGNNSRMGLGGELWADYLKISANGYQRLSGWHQSRDFDDYDERPANGFDVQLNGFIPAYPQLGGKLVFEQYYGDDVALFGKDDRQKDPYAVTMGVNYTPIPMLTLGAEQKMGKSGQNDFNVNMALTYQLDQSWAGNTSPAAVDAMRKLARSRYDLVERNNNIILEYRKQQIIKLHLAPERVQGESKSTQTVTAQVSSKNGLKDISWTGGSFQQAGGTIKALDATHYALTLPTWKVAQIAQATKTAKTKKTGKSASDGSRLLNTYVLTAVAQDSKSNHSSPAHLTVEVLPPQAHFSSEATVSGDNAAADGVTPVNVVYHIVDGNKQALPGERVTLVITLPDGSKTTKEVVSDAQGNVSIDVVSLLPGEATVEAQLSNGESSRVTIHFADAQPDAAHSLLTASPKSIAANGKAISTLTLALHDSLDRPLSGRSDVKLHISGIEGTRLSAVKETSAGNYTATLSGTLTGTASITAEAGGSTLSNVTTDVLLTSDESTAQVKDGNFIVIKDNVPADGKTPAVVKVTVTDASGNPLAHQKLTFSATDGALVTESAVTDEQGQVTVPVTHIHAGAVTVTVTVNGSTQAVQLNFIADASTAQGTLSVTTDGAAANGTATNRVELVIVDANGNPIAGSSITFTADNGATVGAASGVTDPNGKLSTTLTSTTAGISTVTAQSASGETLTAKVTFVADGSTAQIATGDLTVITNDAIANGTARNQVQVKVTDAQGNPLSAQAVSFTATNGATIAATASTDSNGLVTVGLTSLKAGDSLVTATINGSSQTVNTTFIADASTAQGTLTVTADGAVANGTATNRVELTVTDASGNPIAGSSITFTADNGATVGAASGVTDPNGKLSTTLTSTTAGISTVTAQSASGETLTAKVTFVADGSTAQIATGDLTVITNDAIANGTARNQVQVKVTDAQGNPLSAQAVSFTATNGATIAATASTDSNGLVTVGLTSLKAGDSLVTATINGSSQTVNTTFIADASTAQGTLTVTADGAVANGTATNRVELTVIDANGNPLENVVATFTADNSASVTDSVTTNASGVAKATLTSLRAGTATVTASAQGLIQTVPTTFIADAATAQIASGAMTVVANHAATDGVATNSVQVVVTDANGNRLNGQSVSFKADNGATIAASGVSDGNGEITLPITSTTAGDSLVTATINGSSQSVTVSFEADGNTARIADGALVMVDNDALANGSDTNTVRATVTDAAGNPVSGISVSFSATHGATITASGVTDANGEVTATLMSTTAGISTITATVNGVSQHVDARFVADASTAQLAAGDFTVASDGAVANNVSANQVKVRVTDANGNALTAQTVSFSAGNSAKIAASGQTGTDGTLILPVTSTVAGDSLITASINGSNLSVTVHFVYDRTTANVFELTAQSDNALANGSAANTVKVVVKDAYGNLATGMDVTMSASNGASVIPEGVTDGNGEYLASVTSLVAGASVITAQTNGQSKSLSVTFIPDNGTAQIVAGSMTVTKDNAPANGTDNNSVQLAVTDAKGNPLSGQTVSFTADNGATIAATADTGSDGTLTLPITSKVAGSSKITASINGSSQSVTVTFRVDAATATVSALTVDGDNALANGTATNSVKARVQDAQGNPVPDMTVTFSADNGATIAATGVTGPDGTVTVSLTNVTAGVSHVTATVNGNSQSVSVTFVADASTAQIVAGSMTVTKDNALANGTDNNSVQLTVTDANGNPLSGQTVSFTADNGATIAATADSGPDGTLTLPITSKVAGSSQITASINGGSQSVTVTFRSDAATATVSALTVDGDSALANGTATNSVKAGVQDAQGNPVPDMTVTFSADNGATMAATGVTGPDGTVTVSLTNVTAGVSNVTATVNGNSQSVSVTFVADNGTAQIVAGSMTVTKDNAPANGTDNNSVQLAVTDAKGNPVPDMTVTFSADNGATIPATGVTGPDGIVTVSLTNVTAGVSNVTATVKGNSQSVPATFVADASTAIIVDGAMSVVADGAITDGTASNSVNVIVTDANGNLVPGVKVNFAADNDAVIAASGVTDANGSLTMTLTSTHAGGGVSNVTASLDSGTPTQTVQVNFVGKIALRSFGFDNGTVNQPGGQPTGGLTAAVIDSYNGNPIANESVEFTLTNGATFTDGEGTTQTITSDADGLAKVAGVILPNVSYSTSSFKYDISAKTDQVSATITAQATGLVMYPNRNNKPAGGTGKNTDEVYMFYIDDQGKYAADIPVYASVAESTASWIYGNNGSTDKTTTSNTGAISIVVSSSVAGNVTVSGSTHADLSNATKITVAFR